MNNESNEKRKKKIRKTPIISCYGNFDPSYPTNSSTLIRCSVQAYTLQFAIPNVDFPFFCEFFGFYFHSFFVLAEFLSFLITKMVALSQKYLEIALLPIYQRPKGCSCAVDLNHLKRSQLE